MKIKLHKSVIGLKKSGVLIFAVLDITNSLDTEGLLITIDIEIDSRQYLLS